MSKKTIVVLIALQLVLVNEPAVARFLSVDPVKPNPNNGANYNRYTYTNNNPYRYTDPDGREACSEKCMRMRETSDGGIGRPIRYYHPELGSSGERSVRTWLNPTNGGIRGCDGYGCGHNGARRGSREHLGADYIAEPGQEIRAPTNGMVERRSNPYRDDSRYTGVQMRLRDGTKINLWYVSPDIGTVGAEVRTGQRLGISQDLSIKYPGNMTNHTHVRITGASGNIDPAGVIPYP